MARLWDRLFGSPAPSSQRALSAFGPTWSWTPNGGNEALTHSFASYVEDGYKRNGVVFAVQIARLNLFSQGELKFRNNSDKRIFGTEALALLERPWPGGTTADLLARMEQDVSFAGNAYVRRAAPDMLERLRPDLVDVVSVEDDSGARMVVGYTYWRDGRGSHEEPEFFDVADVAHWSPIPDPMRAFVGMSWLTPVTREIDSDAAMIDYKQAFFDNAATPNMLVRYPVPLDSERAETISRRIAARHGGASNAWRTMVIDQGADVSMIGSSFEQMAFAAVQAAGENRICIAAGVPAQVVGISAGLDAGTFANYEQAFKAFANSTMSYNWQSCAAALQKLVAVPSGARLWVDLSDVPALQDAETARAEAAMTSATAIQVLINSGFVADAAVTAVNAGDLALLLGQHTGLVSVQMQAPGEAASAPSARSATPDWPTDVRRSADAVVEIRQGDTPAPVVNVTVEPTPVTVVNEVAAPVVNVEPTPVTVTNEVSAPAVPVNVNVEPAAVAAPIVNVEPAPVVVSNPPRKTTTTVKRDRDGNIIETTSTERDL